MQVPSVGLVARDAVSQTAASVDGEDNYRGRGGVRSCDVVTSAAETVHVVLVTADYTAR